jgi:hypothetical protein
VADSVSGLELIWTAIAVIALGFTAWICDDNVRNYLAIRRAVALGRATMWGPRAWVAVASLVSSIAMFVVWLGFASIGILAMIVSPNDPASERARFSSLTGIVLIAMTLILAGIQAWQVFARTKIRPLVGGESSAVDVAAEQTQHAADLVDALRLRDDETSEARP